MLHLLLIVQCITIQDWIRSPEQNLNPYLLHEFVPSVLNPETPYALNRFSIGNIFERRDGNMEIPTQLRQKPSESLELNERDIEQLSSENKYKLGLVYFWALGGVKRDLKMATRFFLESASNGDANAMFMLGVCYSTGLLGVIKEDQARAQLWYTLAANSNSTEAQIALANRLRFGIHTTIDHDKALVYMRTAGLRILNEIQQFNDKENDLTLTTNETGAMWYYSRRSNDIYAFGSESNTGLYGRNVYRRHLPPAPNNDIWMGEYSTPSHFLSLLYPDEFDSVESAESTLKFRAVHEDDPKAMYALGLIAHAQNRPHESIKWLEMCVYQTSVAPNKFNKEQVFLIHSYCFELLAEKSLQLKPNDPKNLRECFRYYMYAQLHPCKSCSGGKALVFWRMALETIKEMQLYGKGAENLNQTLTNMWGVNCAVVVHKLIKQDALGNCNLNRTALLELFQGAFETTYFFTDYTLGMKLAEMLIEDDEINQAVYVLRRITSDIHSGAPIAALLLAELTNNSPDVLIRYSNAINEMHDFFSPASFAQRRYEEGDIESAVLGFLLSGELGIPSSLINLADLLDPQHSYLGKKIGPNYKIGRALSQWPLPSFVKGNRTQLALKYFLLSSQHKSADSLYKAIELDPSLESKYLKMLRLHDLGMAHFTQGLRDFAAKNYEKALEVFSKSLISPEGWLAVKFWQFITALKLLYENNGLLSWKNIYTTYNKVVSVDAFVNPHVKGTSSSSEQSHITSPSSQKTGLFGRCIRALGVLLIVKVVVQVVLDVMFPGGFPPVVVQNLRQVRRVIIEGIAQLKRAFNQLLQRQPPPPPHADAYVANSQRTDQSVQPPVRHHSEVSRAIYLNNIEDNQPPFGTYSESESEPEFHDAFS